MGEQGSLFDPEARDGGWSDPESSTGLMVSGAIGAEGVMGEDGRIGSEGPLGAGGRTDGVATGVADVESSAGRHTDPGQEVRVARAGLLRVCEPPAGAVVAFVQDCGPVAAFGAIVRGRAPRSVVRATESRVQGIGERESWELAARDLDRAARCGARLVCPEDGGWPEVAVAGFEGAARRGVTGSSPPLALYVRGVGLAAHPRSAVTVVGARASTSYGQRVASELAYGLALAGMTVVSGGAFGIDTAAHRAALSVGASTAVLACGIDRSYPAANTDLLGAVARSGSVVSEYPPGTTPARHRFLVRNRLIAALGMATVVVEAGRRSGSLNTAAAAGFLGRLVLAVPGPVTSAMSVGTHLLLRDRFATLVTDVDDVLAACREIALEAGPSADGGVEGPDPLRPTDVLDGVQARVYDAFPVRAGRTIRELAAESGVPDGEVLAALPVLELYGLVRRGAGRYYRVALPTSTGTT